MYPSRRRLIIPVLLVVILISAALWQFYRQGHVPRALPTQAGVPVAVGDELNLLARLIAAEAGNEPYEGQVAVGAVVLNRVRSPLFPTSISGVIYEPWAFESVHNGLIWQVTNLASPTAAAADALNGWDPTYGALFFWNPAKPVSPWIWTRTIITQIGNHVFAR
ncbi:MAG: N-acetylmuramoyl-L-alanine amidase [Moorella sp. (in: firmicutes)]|jgi:N-acetylmuramoyl-L-alanine amidase|uniref:cell wall hydrolase n=1 Tax=unclassified Neomoorella TaxID=2676739 RepID=UPI0010FFB351|nr:MULTISPECIES: cell wall hydrolase [unclassified Moorella (in: firmicutes)]MDK2816999.1 N-acetylmuramoyl-L-alanine amidase [Moorella sp. (in: firmicutes)]MDK2895465.1 N-acetylmuramoyl-L-alanine amidase [Moorella sp. (in: firmicutes)]GEA14683.1 spore cortex-lytic protein [Moorella sp. E308F]GEA17943.1 spore cortex-lytic protein [Moorella sp. E306M]